MPPPIFDPRNVSLSGGGETTAVAQPTPRALDDDFIDAETLRRFILGENRGGTPALDLGHEVVPLDVVAVAHRLNEYANARYVLELFHLRETTIRLRREVADRRSTIDNLRDRLEGAVREREAAVERCNSLRGTLARTEHQLRVMRLLVSNAIRSESETRELLASTERDSGRTVSSRLSAAVEDVPAIDHKVLRVAMDPVEIPVPEACRTAGDNTTREHVERILDIVRNDLREKLYDALRQAAQHRAPRRVNAVVVDDVDEVIVSDAGAITAGPILGSTLASTRTSSFPTVDFGRQSPMSPQERAAAMNAALDAFTVAGTFPSFADLLAQSETEEPT